MRPDDRFICGPEVAFGAAIEILVVPQHALAADGARRLPAASGAPSDDQLLGTHRRGPGRQGRRRSANLDAPHQLLKSCPSDRLDEMAIEAGLSRSPLMFIPAVAAHRSDDGIRKMRKLS